MECQTAGRRGGLARARRLTPERLAEIAREASTARWHGEAQRELERRWMERVGQVLPPETRAVVVRCYDEILAEAQNGKAAG